MGVKLDISTNQQQCVAGDVVEGVVRADVTTVSIQEFETPVS